MSHDYLHKIVESIESRVTALEVHALNASEPQATTNSDSASSRLVDDADQTWMRRHNVLMYDFNDLCAKHNALQSNHEAWKSRALAAEAKVKELEGTLANSEERARCSERAYEAQAADLIRCGRALSEIARIAQGGVA
jgi:predicted  nucleic acid-binding Zn-ribbon protein